jgi:hypothetical protein
VGAPKKKERPFHLPNPKTCQILIWIFYYNVEQQNCERFFFGGGIALIINRKAKTFPKKKNFVLPIKM